MLALVKSRPEPGLWLEEVPKPRPKAGEVLIRVHKTSICGTDLNIYKWEPWARANVKTPLVIGHEFYGVIDECGPGVTDIAVGDRVCGEGHLVCGTCRNCKAGDPHLCRKTIGLGYHREGAFAEFVTLPATNVYKIPPAVSDNAASIFDPLGNAVHTCLTYDLVGEDVLITGAGPIGIMSCAICKHVGARHIVITDVREDRLKLAQTMGATRCVNVSRESLPDVMKQLDMREGFDIGLEMSGNKEALRLQVQSMNHGGKIALLGILGEASLNFDEVVFKSLTLKGIYGRKMYDTWYRMVSMIQSGLAVEKVITHVLPFRDYERGFQMLLRGEGAKIILDWT